MKKIINKIVNNVIPIRSKPEPKPEPEKITLYDKDFSERMQRIRESLEKINYLMKELKQNAKSK